MNKQSSNPSSRGQQADNASKAHQYQQQILKLLVREKTAQANLQELSSRYTTLTRSYNLLTSQRQQQNLSISKLQRQLIEQTTKYDTLHEQHQTLGIDMQVALKEKMEKEEQYDRLFVAQGEGKRKNQKLVAQVERVREELRVAKENNQMLKGTQQSVNKKCIALQSRVTMLEKQLGDKSQRVVQLEGSFGKCERELAQQLITVKTQSEQICQLNNTIKELNNAAIVYKKDNSTSKDELYSLRVELETTGNRVKELSKENQFMKGLKEELTVQVDRIESEKAQLEVSLKRVEKDLKRERELLKQALTKQAQAEAQLSTLTQKYRQSQRNLKSSRKQLSQLKERVSTAEEGVGDWSNKLKKLQDNCRSLKTKMQELQDRLKAEKQTNQTHMADKESLKINQQQLTVTIQRLKREKQMLSEQNLALQQKRVLGESEKEKALTTLIKQKNTLNEMNQRLLQVLEIKEIILGKIIDGSSLEEQGLATQLQGDFAVGEMLRRIGKQKLRDPKQRVRLIEQILSKR